MANADGIYDRKPWNQNVPEQVGPFEPSGTYEQQMVQQALYGAQDETADSIRRHVPPIPIVAFPPRFGYRNEELGIKDVGLLDQIYQRVDFTGKQSGYQGTSTPSLPAY